MARIWQEGFEDGLPSTDYLEGELLSEWIFEAGLNAYHYIMELQTGRSIYSQYALNFTGASMDKVVMSKVLKTSLNELYFRAYFISHASGAKEIIALYDLSGKIILSIYQTSSNYNIYVRQDGTYASRHTFTLLENVWYKIDIYLKINSSTGAYEVKIDDVCIKSDSSLNTGSSNIKQIKVGKFEGNSGSIAFDDIALNDTSGSINNSWCGSGTIVSLKPKGAGNKSQFDTCEGYAKAESGTTTTNIKITGHGLSTNDVVYNKTQNAYRLITYVDADNFTVSSVTGQTTNDIILLYKNVATITAGSSSDTDTLYLSGHTMKSGDVIVNTSRSNAIRRVYYSTPSLVQVHDTVTSQTSGDSIKTFAFTPYAMTNHYEAVANQIDPSPKLSYIKTTTSGDIDTFDMEELSADKSIPSGATVVAVSHNIYAQEAGAGTQLKPVFRISGTDYEGSTIGLSGGTLQYQTVYDTSPATSSQWTRSEVDGLEAGVKMV